MRIGLVAVDSHRFPNLAIGKIASYHKAQGDDVEWAMPLFGEYDKVYQSKIFNFTPDDTNIYNAKEIIKGGTGYSLVTELPYEIDRLQPDYSIYPNVDSKTAYGFLTRGCPNKCPFCIVSQKEGGVRPYMNVEEIMVDGRTNLVAMDNNLLAAGDYAMEQLEKIIKYGYHLDLNQASSARLVTEDVADVMAHVKWLGGMIRFAADYDKQIGEVELAMERIDRHRIRLAKKPASYLIYTIIDGNIESCYNRLSYFKKYPRVRIQAQPYRDFNNPNQVIPKWQMDMARWANRKEIYTSCDFKDFQPRKGFTCKEYFK